MQPEQISPPTERKELRASLTPPATEAAGVVNHDLKLETLSPLPAGVVPAGSADVVTSAAVTHPVTSTAQPGEILAEKFRLVCEELRTILTADAGQDLQTGPTSLSDVEQLLDREIAREQLVENHIQALGELVTQIDRQVLGPAKREFQTVTGFLDNHPAAVAALSGLSGLATFSLAAFFSIRYEHAFLHACTHLVHTLMGDGALSQVASVAASGGALFMQGLACLAGSLVGPSVVGLAKTVGGRLFRNFHTGSQATFEEKGKEAAESRSEYLALVSTVARDISSIQPLLSEFYSNNEKVRLAISTLALAGDFESRSADGSAHHTDIHRKSTALGAAELLTLMRSLNLERSIREMAHNDFRSPELIAADSGSQEAYRPGIGFVRGLRMAYNFFTSLVTSSTTIGHRSALGAAVESRDLFESLPKNMVTDVVSGMGSGISTTLQYALESGPRPDKTAYAFVKTVIGGAKSMMVGGVAEGPKLETFLKVVFELDELEKGNKVRWISKLIPCLIRAATQKPVLMERAEQVEALSGSISPKSLSSEIAERQGRLASAKKMASELTKLIRSAVAEGLEQYLFTTPLDAVHHSPLIRGFAPGLSDWAGRTLTSRENAAEHEMQEKMAKDLSHIRDGDRLATLTDSELDLYAIQKYIAFSYRGDASVSQEEMSSVIHYWSLRRKAAWHKSKDTESQHVAELGEIGPQFKSLHKILHTETGLFSKVTQALVRREGALNEPNSSEMPLTHQMFKKWRETNGEQHETQRGLILDSTSDGLSVAALDRLGRPRLLNAGEFKQMVMELGDMPLQVLPHADEARITASEMLLATRLEPFQRRALLEVHYALSTGTIDTLEAIQQLERHSFSQEQLLGSEDSNNWFPGLIPLGLIGRRDVAVA